MRPGWLRPPDLLCGSSNAACGAPLCRSGVTTRTAERRPAEVGLNFINGMGCTSGLGRYIDGLAIGQTHVRLAPIAATANTITEGLALALDVDHVDGLDLDVEQLLNRGLYIGLGGFVRNFEDVLVGKFLQARGLFGDSRSAQHAEDFFVAAHASHSSIFLTASAVITTVSAPTSATGSRPCTSRTSTYGRLRADRYRCSEASSVTISGRLPTSRPFSFSIRPLVLDASTSNASTIIRRP